MDAECFGSAARRAQQQGKENVPGLWAFDPCRCCLPSGSCVQRGERGCPYSWAPAPRGFSLPRGGWGWDGDQHRQPWAPAHGPKCWGIVWLRSLLASDLAGAVRNTVGLAGLLHRSQQLGTMIWGLILHSPAARADAHAEVEPRLPWGSWSRVLGGKNSNGLSSFRTAQGCGCSPCTPRPPNSSTRGSGRSLLPGGPQPGGSEHLLTFGSPKR